MSKVVIAIHGLGNKPPKELLEKWARNAIEEGIKNARADIHIPDFELVYWADILYEKPQDPEIKDIKSPYFLDEPYTRAPKNFKVGSHEIRQRFLDSVKNLAYKILLKENYELRYGFVCQKLLHNYFHEMEIYFTGNSEASTSINCKAKQTIINRLVSALGRHSQDEIMLVSHSMGTIIALDVLSFIAKEGHINTFVTIGSPLGLPFVISRIASQSKKMNQGHIKLQTPEAVDKHWYNFSDIHDKIALDYKLADDFTVNSWGVKVIDKLVTNNYAMNGVANPHKSFGYLRTPEFIQVLSEFLNEKIP
jgi:hypothetical protein